MNRWLAGTLFLVIVLGVGVTAFHVVTRVEANREDSRQRFSQVEIGQSREEVADILGNADPTIQDLATSDSCAVHVKAHETVDPFVELCFDPSGVLVSITPLKAK